MYERRRGIKYANSELKLFIFRYKIKLISLTELILLGLPIILIRLLPSMILKKIYLILRNK